MIVVHYLAFEHGINSSTYAHSCIVKVWSVTAARKIMIQVPEG